MRDVARSQEGFSLIELMTALVVMGVVTAQLFVVMGNQKKVYSSNQRAVDAQETARMTLDLISFDTRMAGYMVPAWTAVSSVDGGATEPDRFCVSSMFVDPGVTGSGNPMEAQLNRWDGATVNPIGGIGTNFIQVADLDMNDDGVSDFTDGAGVIVASPTATYCGHIRNVDLPAVVPLPGAPMPGTINVVTDDVMAVVGGAGSLIAVPANVYELDKDAQQLSRNGMLLASQIEDFQVEFWVDSATPDGRLDAGDTEFPVNDLNAPDPPAGGIPPRNDRIERVRVTVLAVSPLEDNLNAGSGMLSYGKPKIANRQEEATNDHRRRRAFSASILPRNVTILDETTL